MKKILAVCAVAMLCCSLVRAQEADEPGNGVELTVIPRLDVGVPAHLGNSSVYSLFEGNFSNNFSFSVSNHWASFGLDDDNKFDSSYISDLYKNTWHSDGFTWCDWAYLEYALGDFSVRLGKDMLFIGGIEYDDYDFDCHPIMMSSMWNTLPCYQWGGSLNWAPSESTKLGLQMASSPFGEKPFSSGLYSYSLQWTGEYGPLNNIWSISEINTYDNKYFTLISLGQRFAIDDALSVTLDWRNSVAGLIKGSSTLLSIDWAPTDELEFKVKGGWDYVKALDTNDYQWGCSAAWYPAKFDRNLRLNAYLGQNYDWGDDLYATIGVMYYLHIGR